MEKFVIKSQFRCLVECQKKCLELDDFGKLVVETEKTEIVKVYPLDCKNDCYSIAYSFALDSEGIKRDNLIVIKYPKYTEIVLKEKLIARNKIDIAKKSKNNITASLTNYPHIFSVMYNGEIYNQEIENSLTLPEIEILQNHIKLSAKTEKGDFLAIFHLKSEKFYVFDANEICFAQNQFSVFTKLNNIAKHGNYNTYEISADKVTLINRELVYTKNEPKRTPNDSVIPFAFFEAIKENDFALARSYTAEPLAKKLTDKHLKLFFGDYISIEEGEDNTIVLIAKENDELVAKPFLVELVNSEITNVESTI